MRLKRLVVVGKSKKSETFLALRDVFDVTIQKTMPSLWNILIDDAFYYVEPELRCVYKYKYSLISRLNKKLNQYDELKYFFGLDFDNCNIVISTYMPFANLLRYHIEGLPFKTNQFVFQIERYSVFKKIYSKLRDDFDSGILVSNENFCGKIIVINFLEPEVFELLRLKFPNVYIIAHYVDCLSFIREQRCFRDNTFPTYEQCIKKIKCLKNINIFTYNKTEAENFNLNYEVNRVAVERIYTLHKTSIKYQVCFIGTSTYKRFNAIINLLRILKILNVTYIFVVPSFTLSKQEYQTLCRFNTSPLQQIVFEMLSYEKQLPICASSECIVDIVHYDNNEGLPYRIGEALVLGKKIISNRKTLKLESFYENTKIFLCEFTNTVDYKKLMTFINGKDYGYLKEYIDEFDIKNSPVYGSMPTNLSSRVNV